MKICFGVLNLNFENYQKNKVLDDQQFYLYFGMQEKLN